MNLNTNLSFDKIKKWWAKRSVNKLELTFSITGVLMLLVIIWYLIANIGFLIVSFNDAFNVKVKNRPSGIYFQIDEAKGFLIKDN